MLFASVHRCAGLCLHAGNSTQPADFGDIENVNSRQTALEVLTLLDKRYFKIRIRILSQGQFLGCCVWHGRLQLLQEFEDVQQLYLCTQVWRFFCPRPE